MQIIYPRTPLPIALDHYDGCSKSMDELVGGGAQTLARLDLQQCSNAHEEGSFSLVLLVPSGQIFPGGGVLCEKPLQKVGFGALYCL